MKTFTVECKCGFTVENVGDRKQAEVAAYVHETRSRVAHKHDAEVFEVIDNVIVRVIDSNLVAVRG